MSNKNLSVKSLEVVAFDWDNTLALSSEALVFAVNKVLKKYGLPEWSKVKDLRDRTLSFRDNFPKIFGDKANEAYETYRGIYMENVERLISAPQQALAVLNFLSETGVKLVIVTNKDRLLLEFELPFLYDIKLFDRIVCGHEAERDKPYADQLEFAVHDLVEQITPQNVWMIGDSPMDSRCALSAGAKAVRIGQPIWELAEDNEDENILFVDDFAKFLQLLREQN